MARLRRFIFATFIFCLILPGSGFNCQDQIGESEPPLIMDKKRTLNGKVEAIGDFTEKTEATDQKLGGQACISNEACEEGFLCWHKIPRGPAAGIPGSKEKPGKCWNKNDIQRTF
jgi:hypothetical protein